MNFLRFDFAYSKSIDVAHGIGDTALIHFKIFMRLLIFIEVRPIIYQKLQHFANINNFMLK
jgi:hypothetical protein